MQDQEPKKSLPAQQLKELVLRGFFVIGIIAFLAALANFGIISQDQFDSLLEGISGEELPEFPTFEAPTPFPGLDPTLQIIGQLEVDLQVELRAFLPRMCALIDASPDDYDDTLQEKCRSYADELFTGSSFLPAICPYDDIRQLVAENIATYPLLNGRLLVACRD